MRFTKLFIKESYRGITDDDTSTFYTLSPTEHKDYTTYFTTHETYETLALNNLWNKELAFSELPKPLLKQIK